MLNQRKHEAVYGRGENEYIWKEVFEELPLKLYNGNNVYLEW